MIRIICNSKLIIIFFGGLLLLSFGQINNDVPEFGNQANAANINSDTKAPVKSNLNGKIFLADKKDGIPYSRALDNAAIIQDETSSVEENSLLIGNGDLNGLVNVIDGKLVIRLTKNDIGDWRNDTRPDSTLIPWAKIREMGKNDNLELKDTRMGWHHYSYPCPIPFGRVVLDLLETDADADTELNIRKAVVNIKGDDKPVSSVRCLYNKNVILIEGGFDGQLLSHEVEALPSARSIFFDGVNVLFQRLPAGTDWPGMTFAVAMSSVNGVTAVAVVSGIELKAKGDEIIPNTIDFQHLIAENSPVIEAVELVKKTLATRKEDLIADHEQAWSSFWGKSGVRLEDKYLTDTWYRNLYFLRTVSRPGAATVGLFSGLLTDGEPAWHSAHTLNYNTEQSFWSAYACNHLELASSYHWLIKSYHNNAKWLCDQLFAFEGMYVPHNIFTFNMAFPFSDQYGSGVHMHFPWGYSTGITGWVVQNIWWIYEYGGKDPAFLKNEVYPMMKDAALFYANFINTCEKLPNGKVLYGPSVSPEHFGFSKDLSKNWDDIHGLVYARFALEKAIESSEVLNVDEELAEKFEHALKMLPNYPTYGEGEDEVIVNVKGVEPVVCNVPVPVFPVYPGELVTYFSSQKEKDLLSHTITTLKSNGNNDCMILCHARARLSIPGTYEYVVKNFKDRQRSNGILTLNVRGKRFNPFGHYTEMFAASAVVSELVLQSVDDIIRVFPAWPEEKDASFKNLRAKGGFLVSSDLEDGKIKFISIDSTVGGQLSILSPWEELEVYTGNRKKIVKPDENGIVAIETTIGENITLTNIN